jgi:TonB family protein
MSQNQRVRPDSPNASPAVEPTMSARLSARPSSIDLAEVAQIARTLEAFGGGAASADLAFDLVLHDIVEQVRVATRASGAAIALIRNDEMVCRATTGETAPDLGVRVETSSGLAALCVNTGAVQHCKDTESDSRVDAEVCRQLGVRSMLIAPLMERGRVSGILELFSAVPHAFGDSDVDLLQQFATRIEQSRRDLTESAAVAAADQTINIQSDTPKPAAPIQNASASVDKSVRGARRDVWSYILFVLVIAAAIALGLLVGWRKGIKDHKAASVVQPTQARSTEEGRTGEPATSEPSAAKGITLPKAPSPPVSVPAGGLVVTQNGRVIYRSVSPLSKNAPDSSTHRSARQLLRRVEPDYPENARAQHIQGEVVLDVEVLADGKVGNVQVMSGDPLLAQAALQAVKQWRYEPADAAGKGLAAHTQITIRFVLPPN